MEYRRLGASGLEVSVVAMGGWAFGADAADWGPVDDNESIAAMRRGIHLGINLIDTSPTYGGGHSEEIVGKAVRDCRDRVLIATKCGLVRRNGGHTLIRCLRPESIRAECEQSLRRLHVETIDLYQVHRPDPATPLAETVGEMQRLREEGKIYAFGLCNFGCERLSEARRRGLIASLQTPLSLLDRDAQEEILPYCREYNIGVLAVSPLARGLLTGRYDASSRFSDLRAADPRFAGEPFSRNLNLVQCLLAVARRVGCTMTQLALRWVIQQTGVAAAVAGIKRISQVEENAVAGDLTLPPDVLEEVDRILAQQA